MSGGGDGNGAEGGEASRGGGTPPSPTPGGAGGGGPPTGGGGKDTDEDLAVNNQNNDKKDSGNLFVCKECTAENMTDETLPRICKICGCDNEDESQHVMPFNFDGIDFENVSVPVSVIQFFCDECGSSNEVDCRMSLPLVYDICGEEQPMPPTAEQKENLQQNLYLKETHQAILLRMLDFSQGIMLAHALDAWCFHVREHKSFMTNMLHVVNHGMTRNLVARAFHLWDFYNIEAQQVNTENIMALKSELQKAEMRQLEQIAIAQGENTVMTRFVCGECSCDNEIDSCLPMVCEMCRARTTPQETELNKVLLAAKHLQEGRASEKHRRVALAQHIVAMLHPSQLAGAFDGLREATGRQKAERQMAERAMARWLRLVVSKMFNAWVGLVDA